MSIPRASALLLALASTACAATIGERLHETKYGLCGQRIDAYERLREDPEYPSLPIADREDHEVGLASCFLERGRPEKALLLARGWRSQPVKAPEIAARALAAMHDDPAARVELAALRRAGGSTVSVLVDSPEFARVALQDWFVVEVVDAWAKEKEPPLEELVQHLVRLGQGKLVSLPEAWAGPAPTSVGWVLWSGTVTESRIDRDPAATHVSVDGEAGRKFAATFSGASRRIAAMPAVTVFGRFDGRTVEGGVPHVAAVLVVGPKAKEAGQPAPEPAPPR